MMDQVCMLLLLTWMNPARILGAWLGPTLTARNISGKGGNKLKIDFPFSLYCFLSLLKGSLSAFQINKPSKMLRGHVY